MRTLAAALAVALAEPVLWLLGSVGFLARGGILVLALPIWTLPSPVGLTIIFGADALTPTGLSGRFLATLGGLLVGFVAAALGLTALAAWSDRSSITRQRATPDEEPAPGLPDIGAARGSVGRIVLVQVVALAPIVVALLVAGRGLLDIVRVQLLQPGDLATPLVLRVAQEAWPLLVLLALGIGAAEAVGSLAVREVVAGRDASSAVVGALHGLASRPLLAVGTLLAAWATSLIVVGPSAWALTLTAGLVRTAYLDPAGPFRAEVLAMTFLATLFLATAFSAAVILAGFASAVRSHLWTMAWSRASVPAARAPFAFGALRWPARLWTRRRH
jgi:hypothetical protein